MSRSGVILLVTGSTRAASTNTAALRAAVDLAPQGYTAKLYGALAELPAFNPDEDHEPLPEPVARLRAEIAGATGVIFCTPEYAGALPGAFKNLLDWTVGGPEMDRKPVAWINVAAEGRGTNAQASLAIVLGYLGAAVVEDACRRIIVGHGEVHDGVIASAERRGALADVLQAFADGIGTST